MVKMYTSYTLETDDLTLASAEILEQLKPKERMLKNTIALVFFHYEFAGKIKDFADAMPFEIAGCMSAYSGISAQGGNAARHGDVAVSVTMITSDDVFFAVKTIEDIKDKPIEQLRNEVTMVCEDLRKAGKPKMIIPLLPTMPHFCGNDLMNAVNNYDDKLTLFGMHVFNIDGVPDTNYVIAGGKLSPFLITMIAFYGEFEPKFHISASFTFTESFGETVEITDARLSTMKKINGKPALDYFKRYGLITPESKKNTASLIAVPAILTYVNGSKVSCSFIGIDEENGFAIAARTLERGAKIVLSQLDGEKILAGAKDIVAEILKDGHNDCLIFSNAARVWSIGTSLFSEMQAVEKGAKEYEEKSGVPFNYSIAYTGGEICPVVDASGNYYNMVHNYTLIVCAFNGR